jgi:ATP-binding cassette subfamily G (WHITE) protein 2 (PDR)
MEKETITELARAISLHSVKNEEGELVNPFLGSKNPLLDPNSGKFNAKAWLKTIVGIKSRDPARYPKRVAGIAYSNLSAYGYGKPTDYQKTFGNYPLEVLNLFKKAAGKAQNTKIQILRDFDGLVRSGEMLLVLGRPGR